MSQQNAGFPPPSVTLLLRLEGLAVFAAAIGAYGALGGNWWIFALLLLAPDLAMLGALAGEKRGARIYNLAHTYLAPGLLALLGWVGGGMLLVQLAIIWAAHIGMDRALGFGLKYPGVDHATHLGWIGKKAKREQLAHAS